MKKTLHEAKVFKALSNRSRIKILRLLYQNPSSVEELAKALGSKPISIGWHLRSLQEAGFIESYEKKSSVGRPKFYYKIAETPTIAIFPKRRYMEFSKALTTTLQSIFGKEHFMEIIEKIGEDMAEKTVKKLEIENDVGAWSPKLFEQLYVREYLREWGSEPEIVKCSDKGMVYRTHNCLFLELNNKITGFCGALDKGFQKGLIQVTGLNMKRVVSACMARGDPYCEYTIEWLA